MKVSEFGVMCCDYRYLSVVGACGLLLTIWVSGCTTTGAVGGNTIRVEGMVSVRGHEPFTRLVLQTDERNFYVVTTVDDEERMELQRLAPARLALTGTVYLDAWEGRSFAHLRVIDWRKVDESY